MMAGAHVAMMTSALLKYGIEHIGVVLAGMEALDGRARVRLGEADARQHEHGQHRETRRRSSAATISRCWARITWREPGTALTTF